MIPVRLKTSDLAIFLGILMLMIDFAVVVVGLVILIRNKLRHYPLVFWFTAVLFASIPMLHLLVVNLLFLVRIR